MSHFAAAVPLSAEHHLDDFDCGVASLNDWLKRRARMNELSGASRTFVSLNEDRVVGFYCLAAGGVDHIGMPSRLRRNMPDPIPFAVLGRLAVGKEFQGRRLGVTLLQDAVIRTKNAAQFIGIAGLLVHALDESGKRFYMQYGFVEAPANPLTMVLSFKKP